MYSTMGGVDWIRRPGVSQAHGAQHRFITAVALILAVALVLMGITWQHTQQLMVVAYLNSPGDQCSTGAGDCTVRASIPEAPALASLSLGDKVQIRTQSPVASKSAASVKAVVAPGEYLLQLEEPATFPLSGEVVIEIAIEKSIASWISPSRGHVDDSASMEDM